MTYSGHGAQGEGDLVLCPTDTGPGLENAVSFSELRGLFDKGDRVKGGKHPTDNLTILLDCCFASASDPAGKGERAATLTPTGASAGKVAVAKTEIGSRVFCASERDEQSYQAMLGGQFADDGLQVAWLASQNGGNGGSSDGSTTPKTPMTLKHLSGSLNFATSKDVCTLSGSLPSIAGPLSLAGAIVHAEIGGASIDFTFAKTGRAKTTDGTIRLSTKPKNGALTFTLNVRKALPTLHADPQASPAAAKTKGPLNVTCDLAFNGITYTATVAAKCSTSSTKAAFRY
jgi:hypothetical protein